VDVTERPIVVAVVDQLLEGIGSVGGMAAVAPLAGGVQYPDVEPTGVRRRVVAGDVVGHVALPEAAAVHRDVYVLQHPALWFPAVQQADVLRKREFGGEPVLRRRP
jgi:hypothetical protein